jgi:hypothetical protein
MTESLTKRQDSSSGQNDGDYGRPSKKQRMSVEPSEEMSTFQPKESVNLSLLDSDDTDEEEFQPVEVTRASDLYLDTVCLVISIVKDLLFTLFKRLIEQSLTLILKKFALCRFRTSTSMAA